jgi:VIT1/CCC1 family predicted Fe2+/Mn2+ transporter
VKRGLDPDLALEVAKQLTAHNALEAHARDELGIVELQRARPTQAALASAATFTAGAGLPLIVAAIAPVPRLIGFVAVASLVLLAALGALAARAGGANPFRGSLRVVFWSTMAMALTALVGKLFGTTV